MASKAKPTRLQSEIEKCRVDGLWQKALDLVKQISSKSPGLDYYVHFILGECLLETYAKENPAAEQNVVTAKEKLEDAERHLKVVLRDNGTLHLEASLLLGKIHFYQASYQAVLNLYENVSLDSISVTSSTPRLLHIVAEAYAIKGLCLEKIPVGSTSKFKAAEKEEKILNCFEKAGDLALLYLQEKDKAIQSWGVIPAEPEDINVGDILETAIQQSPIYYIKRGELDKGVKRFRDLLSTVESRYTQHLRLTIARQLAEVLLRGVCESSYIPYTKPTSPTNNKGSSAELTPRKYSSDRVFVPSNESEEALLLLLIAEAVATREAILNRTTEHQQGRKHTFQNASAIYDLLAIALVKRAQFHRLVESFERALKFSFEEWHIWHQFANSLICDRQYERALPVIKECNRLRPKQVIPVLQAAKICYEHLHKYDEGIKFSRLALDPGDDHPMASRAYVALGIGYYLKAMEMKLKADRQDLHSKALKAFQKAHVLDPSDYLSLFHLALQLAILRQIEDAVKYTKLALKYYSDHIHSLHLLVLLLTAQKQYHDAMDLINAIEDAVKYTKLALKYYSDHIHSLHLLVLLLTAQKQYHDAMDLINAALEEYPDNISLLLTKSKIEEVISGPEVALNTCKNMMKTWKEIHEINLEEKFHIDHKKQSLTTTDRSQFDRRSHAFLQLNEVADRDSGSIRAESLAVSRIEKTLSDLASTTNSNQDGPLPPMARTLKLQSQIWMNLCELYLSLDRTEEADLCVREMTSLSPLSHQVAYMRGRLYEHKHKYREAKTCYEDAVSINPSHTKSLQHLGMVLHCSDENKLAEKVLRDAVNNDPTSNRSWYCLGIVLEALGNSEAASNCQLTALDLEATSPIVPFTVIPRLMQ